MQSKKPIGTITRGTTNPNRLRRVDRYIAAQQALRLTTDPIVVDLGFGASPRTSIEMLERLAKVQPNLTVVGIEIDRERVNRALPFQTPNLLFGLGGFEVPLPKPLSSNELVTAIRAMNVLRQYEETEVASAWELMQSRLSSSGFAVEGTCDEIGRIASWVTLTSSGPKSFTISLHLRGLAKPSKVAERLPKALIHHNIKGEPINRLLVDLDSAWATHSPLGIFSPSQRFVACAQDLRAKGWQIALEPKRWRLGEITLPWSDVAPLNFG